MASVRFAAGGLLALTSVVIGGAGCRHAAAEPEALVMPIDLAGPKCAVGGPAVDIVKADPYRCGKGDTCTRVDMRIRNPEGHALFLLTDGDEPFSGYLESVSILFGRESPKTPVWQFIGQGYHQAFRLPPAADVMIRSLEFHTALEDFIAVFLDWIALGRDRRIDGTGRDWMMPPRGEFDMRGMGGAITDYESRPLFELTGKEHVEIGVRCVQKAPVPAPPPPPVSN